MSAPRPADAARADEALAYLQRLLRFDTTNPPGRELLCARWLAGVLEGEGVESLVLETAPERGCVVGRVRGTGEARPLLLLAHMDVVGADAARWSVPPFDGVVRDGAVYGRGAIDDKGMLAVHLATVVALARECRSTGRRPVRDVVLVATADEETGSEAGLAWLLAHRPELLEAEFALNEGGRVRVVDGRPRYAAIQVAEKVPHLVTVTARGPGGHAAVPLPTNAITRLARALARLGDHREPLVLTGVTRRFFGELAAVWPHAEEAAAMRRLVSETERDRGAAVLAGTPVFDAVLRAGVSPVLLAAGTRENVIPGEASATLAVRTLPGQSLAEVLERLRTAVDDSGVELAVAHEGEDAPASDPDSPLYRALADAMRAEDPTLAVVPYLSTGATDNARLRRAGIPAYGLLPFPLDADDEGRMHAHDERLPLAALAWGVRVVHDAVRRVAFGATAAERP